MTRFHEFALGLVMLAVSGMLRQHVANLSGFEDIVGTMCLMCGIAVCFYALLPKTLRENLF
jgi:cyanate permease